jgi:hypothetical protein
VEVELRLDAAADFGGRGLTSVVDGRSWLLHLEEK